MNNKRAVYKCDIDGNVIKEYPDIKTAAEDSKINASSITNCLRGRGITAGGFVWKYCNKYLGPNKDLDDTYFNGWNEDYNEDDEYEDELW